MNSKEYKSGLTKKTGKTRLFIFALLLLTAGTLLFLKNLGIVDNEIVSHIFTWPSVIIAVGILTLAGGFRGNWFPSLILFFVGGFFLYKKIYAPEEDLNILFWSLLLMFIGLSIIIRVMMPRKFKNKYHYRFFCCNEEMKHSDDYLEFERVFGGSDVSENSKNFKGGSVSFVFGGGDIDLRNAELSPGINKLKIECVFGGVKLIVPEHWDIAIESESVFGGVSDQRKDIADEKIDKSAKLIVSVSTVFGGATIVN